MPYPRSPTDNGRGIQRFRQWIAEVEDIHLLRLDFNVSTGLATALS